MARFLHGLNDEISDFVEMFPYDALQDVVHQAIRVNKKNMHNGRTRAFQGRTTTRSWQRTQHPMILSLRVHHLGTHIPRCLPHPQ